MTFYQVPARRQDIDTDELFRRMERLRDGNARLHASQRQTVRTLERTCREHDALLRALTIEETRRREEAVSMTAAGDHYQAACAAAIAAQLADLLRRFGYPTAASAHGAPDTGSGNLTPIV